MIYTEALSTNVFIKLSVNFEDVDKFLDKYGIKVIWLPEGGLAFQYPEERYKVRRDIGDLSFLDPDTGIVVLTYLENFEDLEFLDGNENLLLSIPIIT